ncbi:polyprenyl synthetase family protein [Pseudacidobacterium ailaaui]|uniref:polyprenyl synthetase family protein n=1 Tax=Pseudacidobacterium ailaaui TaxID=1382359 RepID=UPI00047E4C29|nr:polyprenyl synthetase family protein [Pseudacidobacterium ailaaui]MBX6360008.1 polyprenyl synthetase family protein [Pseudacidobacterium ailaaui]MDI3255922.1 polyprenyl synthetase family protein [Bacillota bacterium]
MSTTTIATAKEVFDLLHDDLCSIEREFGEDAISSVKAITEISEYLREGGGKRIRPSLLLLSARSQGYSGPGMVRLGAVVEMVHTATLVHDDIIDSADTRRGRPSANTTWGNAKCVLAGDWLYMQAFRVALEERNFKVLDLLINLTQQMVEGELLQMETLGRPVTEQEYNDLIYRKTACLFEVSMRLGSVLANQNGDAEAQMGEYGHSLGMAFQIVDDVLDLTATEEVLGKPVASDLREGKATLAVIHSLEHGTAQDREAILKVLSDRSFNRVRHDEILAILVRNGSLDHAMNVAFHYAERARAALSGLPDSDYKRALLWVPDFVLAREK